MTKLRAKAEDLGVTFYYNTKADTILMNENNEAVGVSGALLYIDDARLYGHSIIVNKEGNRFVGELDTRDAMSNAILAQTGQVCYELIDSTVWESDKIVENPGDEVEYMYAMNEFVKADTIEEAAEFFGIDAEALVATVEKYNSYVESGVDENLEER